MPRVTVLLLDLSLALVGDNSKATVSNSVADEIVEGNFLDGATQNANGPRNDHWWRFCLRICQLNGVDCVLLMVACVVDFVGIGPSESIHWKRQHWESDQWGIEGGHWLRALCFL